MGIHAHRGRVDDEDNLGAQGIGLGNLRGTGSGGVSSKGRKRKLAFAGGTHHKGGTPVGEHGANRRGRPTVAQDKAGLPGNIGVDEIELARKPVVVGVVGKQRAVFAHDEGVCVTEPLDGLGTHVCRTGGVALVRNRHVEAAVATRGEKRPHLVARHLHALIGHRPQKLVDTRGVAVAEPLPHQAEREVRRTRKHTAVEWFDWSGTCGGRIGCGHRYTSSE